MVRTYKRKTERVMTPEEDLRSAVHQVLVDGKNCLCCEGHEHSTKYFKATLHRKASVSLPTHDSTNSLYNSFSKHFKDKITQIQISFPGSDCSCNFDFSVAQCLNQHHLLKFLN